MMEIHHFARTGSCQETPRLSHLCLNSKSAPADTPPGSEMSSLFQSPIPVHGLLPRGFLPQTPRSGLVLDLWL